MRLAPFKSPKLTLLENHYKDLNVPQNYEFVLKDNIPVVTKGTADSIVCGIQSWSAFPGLLKNDRECCQNF